MIRMVGRMMILGFGVKDDGAYSEFGRPVEIRINEDGYRAGGSWFEGNWMDPSTDMVGCGKNGRSSSVNIHGVASPKPVVHMSQAKPNYYDSNIIGFKGMSGCRKRKAVGMSGGWLAGGQESRRAPWKQPRRKGKLVSNDVMQKDIKWDSNNVHLIHIDYDFAIAVL